MLWWLIFSQRANCVWILLQSFAVKKNSFFFPLGERETPNFQFDKKRFHKQEIGMGLSFEWLPIFSISLFTLIVSSVRSLDIDNYIDQKQDLEGNQLICT